MHFLTPIYVNWIRKNNKLALNVCPNHNSFGKVCHSFIPKIKINNDGGHVSY